MPAKLKHGVYATYSRHGCRCDECFVAAMDRGKQRRENAYARLRALKEGKPCADCGNVFPPECMDFDHKPGTEKLGNVAQLVSSKTSLLLSEIEKCELVCANCHRVRTFARRRGYNKRRFFEKVESRRKK